MHIYWIEEETITGIGANAVAELKHADIRIEGIIQSPSSVHNIIRLSPPEQVCFKRYFSRYCEKNLS